MAGIVMFIFAKLFKSDLDATSPESKSKQRIIEKVLEKDGKRMKLPANFDVRFRREKDSGRLTAGGPARTEDIKKLAEDFEVDDLMLKFSRITVDGISALYSEPLTRLSLFKPELTDGALKAISRLKNLEYLEIKSTDSINDQTIKELTGPKQIQDLRITHTNLGDSGITHLARTFPNLESITLQRNPKINGEGFDSFSNLKRLKKLELEDQKLGRAAFENLARIKSLKHLELRDTGVVDEDTKYLARMNLKFLDLSKNNLTDTALKNLETSKSLQCLIMIKCPSLTDNGIKRFARINKKCTLYLKKKRKRSKNSSTKLDFVNILLSPKEERDRK